MNARMGLRQASIGRLPPGGTWSWPSGATGRSARRGQQARPGALHPLLEASGHRDSQRGTPVAKPSGRFAITDMRLREIQKVAPWS